MKRLFLLLFFVCSRTIFSQNIYLDTIQKLNNKKVYSIKIEKLTNTEFLLTLKNIGKKDVYFANFSIVDQKLLNGDDEKIVLGENSLVLEDFNNYDLFKIKSMDEVKIKYSTVSSVLIKMKLDIHVSFMFKNKHIKNDKERLFIDKRFLLHQLRKYTYDVTFQTPISTEH